MGGVWGQMEQRDYEDLSSMSVEMTQACRTE